MSSDEIKIPTEILQGIFHLLCDKPIALHDLKNESHFHEFLWAVGQVCRYWRGAFLSHTPLWTSFSLGHGTFRTPQFFEMNRRATLYLERSGQLPLTIFVSMPASGTQEFPKRIWGMLLSCLNRWKKADLRLGRGAALVLDGVLKRRECLSSLESLRISIPNSPTLKDHNAFQIAPHLTELDLSHPGYAAILQLPCAQLTKLKVDALCGESDDCNNLLRVLFQLENIEELHLRLAIYTQVLLSPALYPIIRLPGLRLLEISLFSAIIFSWFTVPLLEHLHIRFLHNEHTGWEGEIRSLIQRSSCHIRRLVLDNCGGVGMRAMKALAGVEELSINFPTSTLGVIQELTELDGCIYLPKLRVLQVQTRAIHQNMVEKLVTAISRLLEARGKRLSFPSHDVVPLEKFVVWFQTSGKIPDKVLEVMRGWPPFAQVYINVERLTPSP
ncbi:hypothetical protein F5887DRAFT_269725 [Amanita rubescens]|nr:hypothetical protein F5887DRAFT_269725 [Amanita rubescens]